MKKRRCNRKKGSITIYFVTFMAALFIIIFAAVLAPAGVLLNTELYLAGEGILADANESMAGISDATVRSQLQNATGQAMDSAEFNVETLTDFFQYSWIIVIVLVGFIAFLYTRSMVERQAGGGFI